MLASNACIMHCRVGCINKSLLIEHQSHTCYWEYKGHQWEKKAANRGYPPKMVYTGTAWWGWF